MEKRLLALLAALTLALALTACGGETNTEEPNDPPQQVAGQRDGADAVRVGRG